MASVVGSEQVLAANRKEEQEQENRRFKLQVLSLSLGGHLGRLLQTSTDHSSGSSLPSAMSSSPLVARTNVGANSRRPPSSGRPREERAATSLTIQQKWRLNNSSNNHNHCHHNNQSQQQHQQDHPLNTKITFTDIGQQQQRPVLPSVSHDRLQANAGSSARENSRIGGILADKTNNSTTATGSYSCRCCCCFCSSASENKYCSFARSNYKNVPLRSHIKQRIWRKQHQQKQQATCIAAKQASLPMPFIFCTFILMIILANFTPATEGVDCFKCSSRNGSNPDCEDPFHNLNTTRITSPMMPDPAPNVVYHTPCYAGKKGRDGLFPARACIKLTGTFDNTGETLVVRHCALDHGTLTQDTEIARMSHCGQFQFEGDMLKGCVLACPEDACNSAPSSKLLKMPDASLLAAFILAHAALAFNKLLAQHGITHNILYH